MNEADLSDEVSKDFKNILRYSNRCILNRKKQSEDKEQIEIKAAVNLTSYLKMTNRGKERRTRRRIATTRHRSKITELTR